MPVVPWPESNQHSLRNSILSRARLPVPPQGPSDAGLRAAVAKPAEYSGRFASGSTRADVNVASPRQCRCRRDRTLLLSMAMENARDDRCRRKSVACARLAANPALIGGAGDRGHRRRDAGGRLVLPAGAGYPAPVRSASSSATPIIWRSRSACWSRSRPRAARRGRCCWPALPCSCSPRSANAWLGGYHAGVEWKFWQGPTDCTGPVGNLGSAGTLAAAARHRESDPLRRGAVALPRPLARRLQRADLAVDGSDGACGGIVAAKRALAS